MKLIRTLLLLLLSLPAISQVENRIPQYTFVNKLGVGRYGNNDTTAYLHIGTTQSTKGVMMARVIDTASVAGNKPNGLLIFSVQLNRYAWWDSTSAIWASLGGSTGSTNTNVGSSYRWAIPGTNQIKTFASAYGLTLDSATSNTLTGRVDTFAITSRLRDIKGLDSLGAIIATKGTVTEVVAGYGIDISGGSFTTSGFVNVDSFHMATRLRVQKQIDSLAASGATIDNTAVSGFALLDMSDPDYVWAKRLVFAGSLSADSTDTEITITGNTFLSALTGDVDVTSSPPTSDNWHLGWNNSLSKWVARENAVIYPIMDGDSLRIVSGTDSSGGVFIDGGSGCTTCWTFDDQTTIGATGYLGSADNYGFEIHTNNTKRGEVTAAGGLIWNGGSLTGGLSAAFGDTTGMDYLRMGGVITPFSGAVGLNSRIVIRGPGTTSTTGGFTYVNNTPATVFAARDDGTINMPFVFSSITANGLRFTGSGGGATGILIQPGNTAGISGNLMTISNFTAQSNIGATTSALLRFAGTYQEITPYDDAGNYRVLVNDFTFNGTAGKGPGYVAGYESEVNHTDIPNFRAISIIDSGYTYTNGAVHIANIKSPATSGDYTVAKEDYFIYLSDLTTPAANRNVVMSAPLTDGRMLVIYNTSSDATYKWSFSGTTVTDASGATITTLTDQKCYTLIYHLSGWRVISVY